MCAAGDLRGPDNAADTAFTSGPPYPGMDRMPTCALRVGFMQLLASTYVIIVTVRWWNALWAIVAGGEGTSAAHVSWVPTSAGKTEGAGVFAGARIASKCGQVS